MLQDTYQTYSIIMFIQTILDSWDHMLTNTRELLLHMVTYGDKAFVNFVPKLWNKLPLTLRSADKLKKFKSMLKTHLFPHWNFFHDFFSIC